MYVSIYDIIIFIGSPYQLFFGYLRLEIYKNYTVFRYNNVIMATVYDKYIHEWHNITM